MIDTAMERSQDSLTLEGLPPTAAVEISVVDCGQEFSTRYHELRNAMLPILKVQPGFIAWRAFESTGRPGVMLDLLYWERPEHCARAGESLQNHPMAQEFFALMKQTLIFEMFRRQPL
jgi:hypothetical protein